MKSRKLTSRFFLLLHLLPCSRASTVLKFKLAALRIPPSIYRIHCITRNSLQLERLSACINLACSFRLYPLKLVRSAPINSSRIALLSHLSCISLRPFFTAPFRSSLWCKHSLSDSFPLPCLFSRPNNSICSILSIFPRVSNFWNDQPINVIFAQFLPLRFSPVFTDEDIVVAKANVSTKCPITSETLEDPVRNTVCGEKQSISTVVPSILIDSCLWFCAGFA